MTTESDRIAELTEGMEMLEAGCYNEDLARRIGEKEAARRTRIGYTSRFAGIIVQEHKMNRETYWQDADGVNHYYQMPITERLFHPVVEEV